MTLKRPIETNAAPLSGQEDEFSRRQFLSTAAACTATLALTPSAGAHPLPNDGGHTLFFNFSHEDHEGHTYYLLMGKRRYRLERVHREHPALARLRKTNRFLRALPPGALTHVIENIQVAADEVVLSYMIKDPDTASGTWAMSSLYLHVSSSGLSYAYAQARKSPVLTLESNLRRLALHGFLHLTGYDHENDNGEMRAIEIRLRRKFKC